MADMEVFSQCTSPIEGKIRIMVNITGVRNKRMAYIYVYITVKLNGHCAYYSAKVT